MIDEPLPAQASRICYVHIGTHKTGTTSLQRVLAANDRVFADAGIWVPRAGRPDDRSGHHNVAWELNGDERFDPTRGTFADMLDEIARQAPLHACVSSEDFEYLGAPALRTLADGIRGIGYRPLLIAYLRPQAGYAESLYAELVRHGLAQSFAAFFDTIVETGEYRFNERWRFTFDYERLLDTFAVAFGSDAILVRRYEAVGTDVVRDFLPLIGADTGDVRRILSGTRRLNAGLRCADVLERLERNVTARTSRTGALTGSERRPKGRFDPVHLTETRRIVERFNAGNVRVYEKYGALVPCVSGSDLVVDIATELGVHPGGRRRKRVVDTQARRLALHGARSTAPLSLPSRRRSGPLVAPRFLRPTRIEAVLLGTAVLVAIAALGYGSRTGSTALVEFGLLSAIVAASAATMILRYVVESSGVIADNGFLDAWCARSLAAGYAVVATYALVNALLDVGLSRYEPDWISYPGAIAAASAAAIITAMRPLRRRLLGQVSRRPLFAGVRDDRLYLTCAYIIVLGQVVHAVVPDWWLDTMIDVVVVALIVRQLAAFRRAPRRSITSRAIAR